MKNRTDKILLAVFLLSQPLYAFLILSYLEVISIDFPLWSYTIRAWLALGFHAVPVFCLQLLLCRNTRRWVAVIPGAMIASAALGSVYGWLTATGWDSLGWAILFWLTIAPAAGCALAWTVYGCWSLYQKGDIRNA